MNYRSITLSIKENLTEKEIKDISLYAVELAKINECNVSVEGCPDQAGNDRLKILVHPNNTLPESIYWHFASRTMIRWKSYESV